MKVTGTFKFKNGWSVISGTSPWDDNICHKPGDIVSCNGKKWKVIAVDHIRQGCFGKPTSRMHGLRLEPIDHQDQPQIGDELV